MLRGIGRATGGAALAATGATQGTAAPIQKTVSWVQSTSALQCGIMLPVGNGGDVYWVISDDDWDILVYPQIGGAINNVTNFPITIAGSYVYAVVFICHSPNEWASGQFA